MTRIPESVKVGAHTYRIERHCSRDMGDCMADTDDDNVKIRLRKGMRRSKSQEFLLHETIHAALYAKLHDGVLTEEDFVRALSPALMQILQDNPELVEYITQK